MKRWQLIATAVVVLILLVSSVLVYGIYLVNDWFTHNQFVFKTPVEVAFHEPITIAKRLQFMSPIEKQVALAQEVTVKKLSKEEYIKTKFHAKQIMYIWDHETSMGKPSSDPTALHEKCKAKGQSNEFGFSPFDVTCFDTFEQAVDRVDRWLTDEDKKALCRYNKGTSETDCPYVAGWK